MSVKINPTSVIKARLGIETNGPAQKFFTNTCNRYMDKYVPFETGMLRNNKVIEDDTITYTSEYAHYLYRGTLYVDPNTGSSWAKKNVAKIPTNMSLQYHSPATGARWDKKMWTAEGKDVVKEVQAYIDRGCR